MKKAAWVALLLFILSLGFIGASCHAGVQPVESGFLQKAMRATFALYGQLTVTEPKPTTVKHFVCTATAVSKQPHGYLLLSAGHCIADTPKEVVYLVSEQIGGALMHVQPIRARLGGPEDFSLFYLPTENQYPMMEFGDEGTEHIGDEIVNPNFTSGLVKQLSFGRIASQEITAAVHCDICLGEFLVDNVANGGASGSAVLSMRTHKVIGLDIAVTEAGTGVEPISVVKKALTEPDMYETLHVKLDEDDDDK